MNCRTIKILLLCSITCVVPLPLWGQESQKHQAWTYHVDQNMHTLGEISLFLYEKVRMYKQIAKWNGIRAPYRIKLGQKLILKKAPILSASEGSLRVLEMWRKRFGFDSSKTTIQQKEEIRQKYEEAKPLITKEVEFMPTSAEQLFENGKKLFDEQKYEEALFNFRKSRESSSEYLPPWFYELRVLRVLQKTEEEQHVKELFIKTHPSMSELPFLSGGQDATH